VGSGEGGGGGLYDECLRDVDEEIWRRGVSVAFLWCVSGLHISHVSSNSELGVGALA
jgi:hypothetical protein